MPTPARINGSAAAVRIGLSAGHSGLDRPRPSRARTPHGRVFLQPAVNGTGGLQVEPGQDRAFARLLARPSEDGAGGTRFAFASQPALCPLRMQGYLKGEPGGVSGLRKRQSPEVSPGNSDAFRR